MPVDADRVVESDYRHDGKPIVTFKYPLTLEEWEEILDNQEKAKKFGEMSGDKEIPNEVDKDLKELIPKLHEQIFELQNVLMKLDGKWKKIDVDLTDAGDCIKFCKFYKEITGGQEDGSKEETKPEGSTKAK